MRTEQIEFIRQKCIEANLDRFWNKLNHPDRTKEAIVRLADVLLTIGNKYSIQGSGHFMWYGSQDSESLDWNEVWGDGQRRVWNLRQDDLTAQSNECVSFLYELLQ